MTDGPEHRGDGPEMLGDAPEVLGHGSDRERAVRRPLPRAVRASGFAVALAVAAVALWVSVRPQAGAGPTAAASVPASPGPAASSAATEVPEITAGLPVAHDLTLSRAATQRSFIAFGTHVILFLDVTYTGRGPVRVEDGQVPQDGSYPDPGPGGQTAGTSQNVLLRHGIPTEVFVRIRLDCSRAMVGGPADHLDLATRGVAPGAAAQAQIVDLTALGTYWDEARHAACGHPDADTALTEQVGQLVGTASTPPRVSGVLQIHNSAGLDALVEPVGSGGGAGLSVSTPTVSSDGLDVAGGGTVLVPVRWTVDSCPLAQRGVAPGLGLRATLGDTRTYLAWTGDAAFDRAWQAALAEACAAR